MKKVSNFNARSALFLSSINFALAQSTTGSISGTVSDEKQAIIAGATVTARNVDTGTSRTAQTDGEGRFRFVNLPVGAYQVTIEAANFAKFVQTGITLVVNQDAVIEATLKAGNVQETVTITENASVLNTTTAEVSTRFDEKRLSELPIATNRNVLNVLLSVPGVSQLGSGQTGFANGISFSANGGRLRSNNFMIDGQDINDPSVSGGQLPLNNPDSIQEVRIITNQFLAEFGRNSGSVVNVIGKSGTNEFHGTAFWFHNNKRLNACSNLDKAAGNCNPNATTEAKKYAPFRLENQIGFTFGGPLHLPWFGEGGPYFRSGKDKTFFFGDYQRWTDRALGSGFTLNGAPTEAGRAVLQSAVGNLPQIRALLQFVPAGTANGQSRTFTFNGTTYTVPLGNITGSSAFKFDDDQGSFRIDHRINASNLIYGRYRFASQTTTGTGQVTPPGLTTEGILKSSAATLVWSSVISSRMANELRFGYARYDSTTNASDPSSETIPSIEIADLGLTGFNAAANRTAIGLAVNLPQFRVNNTYQIQDNLSYSTGNHNLKFGVDARWNQVKSFFFPTVRGRLAYASLQNYVNDFADTAATINRPLAGGDIIGFYTWKEFYTYVQDEWKIAPNFTLTLGLRYENGGDSSNI
ncbi:MAG: TonB-dependent receptor [Blastocatellia bacterium]|nr:TonB-dependent receptor [Blastocatellia bacterium]